MDHLTDGVLIGRPPAGRSPTAGSRRRRHDDRGQAHPGPTRAYPAAQSAASGTHLITPQAATLLITKPPRPLGRPSHHASRHSTYHHKIEPESKRDVSAEPVNVSGQRTSRDALVAASSPPGR